MKSTNRRRRKTPRPKPTDTIEIDLSNLTEDTEQYLHWLIHQKYKKWHEKYGAKPPEEQKALKLKKHKKYTIDDEKDIPEILLDHGKIPIIQNDVDDIPMDTEEDGTFSSDEKESNGSQKTQTQTISVHLTNSFIASNTKEGIDFFGFGNKKLKKAGSFKVPRDVLPTSYRLQINVDDDDSYKIEKLDVNNQFLLKQSKIEQSGNKTEQITNEVKFKNLLRNETEITNRAYPGSERPPVFRKSNKKNKNNHSKPSLKSITITQKYGDEDLFDFVNRRSKNSQALTFQEIFYLLILVAKELEHVHQQEIVHRDIKLENIMYNGQLIKLIDFGLSYILNSSTTPKNLAGSLLYVAPEVLQTQDTDMFAFWICVLQLLGINLREIENKCLQENPERSFVYTRSPQKARDILGIFRKHFRPPNGFLQCKPLLENMLARALSPTPRIRPTATESRVFLERITPFINTPTNKSQNLTKEQKKIVMRKTFIDYIQSILPLFRPSIPITYALKELQLDLLNCADAIPTIISNWRKRCFDDGRKFDEIFPLLKNVTLLKDFEKNITEKQEIIEERKKIIEEINQIIKKRKELFLSDGAITVLKQLQCDLLNFDEDLTAIIDGWKIKKYSDKTVIENFPFLNNVNDRIQLEDDIRKDPEINLRKKMISQTEKILQSTNFFKREELELVKLVVRELQTDLLQHEKPIAEIINIWRNKLTRSGEKFSAIFPFLNDANSKETLELALLDLLARQKIAEIQARLINKTWIIAPSWLSSLATLFCGTIIYNKTTGSEKIVSYHAAQMITIIEEYNHRYNNGTAKISRATLESLKTELSPIKDLKEDEGCWIRFWRHTTTHTVLTALKGDITNWLEENKSSIATAA